MSMEITNNYSNYTSGYASDANSRKQAAESKAAAQTGSIGEAVLSKGAQEVSVIFSSSELEKMASDEKYEKEYMERVQGALRMSEQINREFGFTSAFGEKSGNSEINKIGISFNSDGTTSFLRSWKSPAQGRGSILRKHGRKNVRQGKSRRKRLKRKGWRTGICGRMRA